MAAPAGTASLATGALRWSSMIGMGAVPSGRLGILSFDEPVFVELAEADGTVALVESALSAGADEPAETAGDDFVEEVTRVLSELPVADSETGEVD